MGNAYIACNMLPKEMWRPAGRIGTHQQGEKPDAASASYGPSGKYLGSIIMHFKDNPPWDGDINYDPCHVRLPTIGNDFTGIATKQQRNNVILLHF